MEFPRALIASHAHKIRALHGVESIVGRNNGMVGLTRFQNMEMTELSFGTKESGRNNWMVVWEGFTVYILKHRIFVRRGAQHNCEECFCIQAREKERHFPNFVSLFHTS